MDLKNFPEGGVLVGTAMAADFVVVMKKAAAIVTETGSVSGHMASLAREYEVPTIVDAAMATSIIENGQEITVDAVNCNIYEGKV
jgi:pyruvate,water dikinase